MLPSTCIYPTFYKPFQRMCFASDITVQIVFKEKSSPLLGLVPTLKRNALLCMYGHTYRKSIDQPGKVVNPARGQLNRENEYFPVPVCA